MVPLIDIASMEAAQDAVTGLVFYEVAALLVLASALGLLGLYLRQPLIIAFIAAGIVAGPDVLGVVQRSAHIELLAEIGIALLLFLVGLKLDVKQIRLLGAVATATGLGQIVFTAAIGFLICLALGMDAVTAAYVATALTFSSTIIIVKLLSDKREIDSLHGRIALGFLIVQDLAVVLAMVILSAYGIGAAKGPFGSGFLGILAGGAAMITVVAAFIRYAAEPLLRRLASMPDLMVVFAIGWAMLLASVGDALGFGKELGGLLAGVSLASSEYREVVASRLNSVRDFLLLFFFINLGTRLELGLIDEQVASSVVLALFVLIGNPLIVLVIMGYMGYRKRTGFLAGLTVAQISEFSLIFVAMGLSLGHLDRGALALVTLVGMVTITLSTYMILYSEHLYRWLEPVLGPFERRVPYREAAAALEETGQQFAVILFGLGRFGREVARHLQERRLSFVGVDFDPQAVADWQRQGLPACYGDASDPEFPQHLPLSRAAWIIVTIPRVRSGVTHDDVRLTLMQALRSLGFRGQVAVASDDERDAERLKEAGADLVLLPFADAAERAVARIAGETEDYRAISTPTASR